MIVQFLILPFMAAAAPTGCRYEALPPLPLYKNLPSEIVGTVHCDHLPKLNSFFVFRAPKNPAPGKLPEWFTKFEATLVDAPTSQQIRSHSGTSGPPSFEIETKRAGESYFHYFVSANREGTVGLVYSDLKGNIYPYRRQIIELSRILLPALLSRDHGALDRNL